MLGTLPPQGIEHHHPGGIGPSAKRFRRDGGSVDMDRVSLASSSPDTGYSRKYPKSNVKPGKVACVFVLSPNDYLISISEAHMCILFKEELTCVYYLKRSSHVYTI